MRKMLAYEIHREENFDRQTVLFVYNNLGIGGITKSLIDGLQVIDYSKYDIALYIRRDDILDCIDEIPDQVDIRIVESEVKKKVFENNIYGRIVKFIYEQLNKHHKYLAKQFFLKYKYPIQRQKEKQILEKENICWDVAISYSTDGDDPIFVKECVKAKKKYIFVHQSTEIAKANIKAMKKYDGIVSVNPTLVPWISNMIKKSDNIYTLENYVDYESIRSKANETQIVHEGKTILSTCGRLCKTKGFDYVVQVAKILKEYGLEFVWYWIGDGPDRRDMENMIVEYGVLEEIKIVGMQKNPYPYIKSCDAYVQPSRAEAYPLTILEAMVLEKVIITTPTKGGKYILQKHGCGMLVEGSAEVIAKEIIKLLESKEFLHSQVKKLASIDWSLEKERYKREWDELLSGDLKK